MDETLYPRHCFYVVMQCAVSSTLIREQGEQLHSLKNAYYFDVSAIIVPTIYFPPPSPRFKFHSLIHLHVYNCKHRSVHGEPSPLVDEGHLGETSPGQAWSKVKRVLSEVSPRV